jgi:alcohol dehydrogenase class IV
MLITFFMVRLRESTVQESWSAHVDTTLIGDMARSIALPRLKRAAGLLTRLLPVPQPTMLVGPGASARLGQAVGGFGHSKVLVVTDAMVRKLGLLRGLTDALAASGTAFVVFDEIGADAPMPQVEEGIARYRAERCDAIVAFGGGSVLDAAKAIGLAVANGKHPSQLVGYFRGRHGPPPLYAVPTTAGTGSEVTVAAVLSDPAGHRKLVIADTRLVPRMAALDPCLMTGLPPAITAATGMDALTHAVEAFIGQWGTPFTRRMSLAAVALIYRHLPTAFDHGQDLAAREQMALAASYAGLAFTRANVGNVHALAHQLGARYHTPHGLANALLLVPVLKFCADPAQAALAQLALQAGVAKAADDEATQAARFIESVAALNARLGIPTHLDALREADIPALAAAACAEANANYPVPQVMRQMDAEALLRGLLPGRVTLRRAPRKAARKTPRKRPAAAPIA